MVGEWGANWESLRALDDGRRRITFAPTVSDEAVWAQLRGVRRLVVVAWSMGVWRANAWLCAQAGALQDAGVAVVGSVAVNGTPFGIDDGLGIARRGFVQTARRLTPDGFALFVNRVRTPLQADLAVGEARLSVEAVEQLRAQLQALVAQAKAVSQLWNWQWAWVARGIGLCRMRIKCVLGKKRRRRLGCARGRMIFGEDGGVGRRYWRRVTTDEGGSWAGVCTNAKGVSSCC
ncbi:pimeloyl-ACP methyl esterase BioG family protein [Rappaport israeli]|uniref:pimeloyl-ACP methyl esterase BioG family protein n=1 Tax=Rappaport israeli TaxID=1839807 RepID=UPI00098F13D4|nr:pimeloyl-ACP methyl esterase BioG family protein [Rappaport israeli]